MKKKLTLSLLGLSAMGCTGLMIPFTTSCTTKETITIQLQPNIRNGIQTNKDSSVLSIIGYNGEDIDVTKVTYDIKDVPKGVVVKIDGSTLSWDFLGQGYMGQFRIVPKMKGHKARETVINVNCLPNKRVLFTTIPSAMTLFPSKSTEFHTLLNEGTIQSNTGRTSYNNWTSFVSDSGKTAYFGYRMGDGIDIDINVAPFDITWPTEFQNIIYSNDPTDPNYNLQGCLDIQLLQDPSNSLYYYQWKIHDGYTFADLLYSLSRLVAADDNISEPAGIFDFNFNAFVKLNDKYFNNEATYADGNKPFKVPSGGEIEYDGTHTTSLSFATFAERINLYTNNIEPTPEPTPWNISSLYGKYSYMTGSDNEINSERFTKFLSLRPNNEFTFPIAQYGVLFGKNSLDLRYDGPPSMNSVTGTEYTTISQQDVDGTNETLKSILEGANVKNLDIHWFIKEDLLYATYKYLPIQQFPTLPFNYTTTSAIPTAYGAEHSIDFNTITPTPIPTSHIAVGDLISDGTSTAKVSGVNETSGYITINTIHKIDATATSAQISPIPGEATSVSVNNLPDVDIRIGDVINAFADDGTESLVGIITEIQTGVSITVETISNYSYPNTTLDPTPGNTTPIRVADLVGAPDSVFAGQVVSDFNGTVGIIETDAPSTTYCDVKTMDLGESDNIDFERFTSTTTNLYLPGAQFNSTLGVWHHSNGPLPTLVPNIEWILVDLVDLITYEIPEKSVMIG